MRSAIIFQSVIFSKTRGRRVNRTPRRSLGMGFAFYRPEPIV